MKILVLLGLFLGANLTFAEPTKCGPELEKGGLESSRTRTAAQLGILTPLFSRYYEDPFVNNLAHDLFASSAEITEYPEFGLSVGRNLTRNKPGRVELDIYHIHLGSLEIGQRSNAMNTQFGLLAVAIQTAIENEFRKGIHTVDLKFSGIVNQSLFELLYTYLWANSTFEFEEIDYLRGQQPTRHIRLKIENFDL